MPVFVKPHTEQDLRGMAPNVPEAGRLLAQGISQPTNIFMHVGHSHTVALSERGSQLLVEALA
jgi:hypothetical protein